MYLFGIGMGYQGAVWWGNCKQIQHDVQKASSTVARFKKYQKEKLNPLFEELIKK